VWTTFFLVQQTIQLKVEQYQLTIWLTEILVIDCLAECCSCGCTALPNTLGCHMVCVIWCVSHKRTVFRGLWIMDSVIQFFKHVNCCFCLQCQIQCNIEQIFTVETYIRKKSYKKCYSKFRRWFPEFSFPLTSTEEQTLTANTISYFRQILNDIGVHLQASQESGVL
jgi:hypothetical protein